MFVFYKLQGDMETAFDDKAPAIIIEEQYALLPYMRKTERRRLATITSEQDWQKSSYSRIADGYIGEMAMWFWIDLQMKQPPEVLGL